MRSVGCALIQYDCCPYTKGIFGDRYAQMGTPCEEEGRDWSDAFISHGTQSPDPGEVLFLCSFQGALFLVRVEVLKCK